MGYLPIYWQSAAYAREHGEREAYFASKKANIACRDAIETAARENYRDNSLNTIAILDDVVSEYGYDRVMLVLAATIRDKEWDQRISRKNMAWAKAYPVPEDTDRDGRARYLDYTVNQVHPGLTDLLVSNARKYLPRGCYSVLRSTGDLVILKRGESGYYRTGCPTGSKEEAYALADKYNALRGISKAQAAAMEAGSMFGWETPAADPRNYDADGKPVWSKRNTRDKER